MRPRSLKSPGLGGESPGLGGYPGLGLLILITSYIRGIYVMWLNYQLIIENKVLCDDCIIVWGTRVLLSGVRGYEGTRVLVSGVRGY